jgi:phosphopantetheinyl transferase
MIAWSADAELRVATLKSETAWETSRQRTVSRNLLSKILEDDPPLRHTPEGRPYLENDQWRISFSHKASVVGAAAVRPPFQVGIDIETYDSLKTPELFFKYALTPEERGWLPDLCAFWSADRPRALIGIWMLKESFAKASGRELTPGRIRCAIRSQKDLIVEYCLDGVWKTPASLQAQVSFHESYAILVCVDASLR